MEAFVICGSGKEIPLTRVIQWEFSYGLGTPCDAFSLSCVWEQGQEKQMEQAARFRAVHEGKTVFTGIVDEYRCTADKKGCRLELSGRGLQGLLLDNQAVPVEYGIATLTDILENHVVPYGIAAEVGAPMPAVPLLTVGEGASEWSVVHEFACSRSGIVPRFTPGGRLVLDEWDNGVKAVIDSRTPVTALSFGENHYGVYSQVVVKDDSGEEPVVLDNARMKERGRACRRVVRIAGVSNRRIMTRVGTYQMKKSLAEWVRCEVTLPLLFYAFPGDVVEVRRGGFGANGTYRVAEAVVSVGPQGGSTTLVLGTLDPVC